MKNRFTGHTRLYLCISAAIIVIALILQICGLGLNLGIDFTGGSILEYSVGEDYDVNDVEKILASVGYTEGQVTKAAPSAASIALQAKLAQEAAEAAEETAETVDGAVEETAEAAEGAVEETAEAAEGAVEETAEAAEGAVEETAEEAAPVTYLLSDDRSGVKQDGLTDLQIRLNLVDEASNMNETITAAVTGAVSGASRTDARMLTYAAITSGGYDTAFTGGYILEFDMGGTYDVSVVKSAVDQALADGGYSINRIDYIPFDPAAEAAAAEAAEEAETAEQAETDAEEAAGETVTAEAEDAAGETAEAELSEEAETPENATCLRILVDLNDVTSQVRQVLETEMSHKYPGFHFVSIDHVSAVAGRDLLSNALKALLIAFVLMLIYIAIRFDPLSGLAALFALLHDVLIMMSFMVFFRWLFQVNSPFIAAVLTIVGYSINNTIIIFDRIRENNKRPGFTQKPKVEIVEMSVASTLSRTINTTLTTLITLVAPYVFGVTSIREFAFPLIVGMLAGTYSSVLLSGQVWAFWSDRLAARRGKGQKSAK